MMRPSLIIIGGFPGSGKSYLAKQYKQNGYIHLSDGFEKPNLTQAFYTIRNSISVGNRYVVCGWSLCGESRRRELRQICKFLIEWKFFHPDRSACLRNIIRDGLYKDVHCNYSHLRFDIVVNKWRYYDVPDSFDKMPIYFSPLDEDEFERFFDRFPQCCKQKVLARELVGV